MSSSTSDIMLTSATASAVKAVGNTNAASPGSPLQGAILFKGEDANGKVGLWITDGTAAGTHELTGIQGANKNGLFPNDLTIYNGKVLFGGLDVDGKTGLWVTDGTAAGTHELTGIQGANKDDKFGLSPTDLTPYNGKVLFQGADASAKFGLWITDGTATGTHELSSVAPFNLTPYNGKVLFGGTNASGRNGLWVTDGTAAGTHELTGVSVDKNDFGLTPQNFTPYDGKVLFQGKDASGKDGLWVTDGTAAGTHEITGIQGANKDAKSGLSPYDLTIYNGKVLFQGLDANGKYGLWVTDGTAAGTHELIQGAWKNGLAPDSLTPYNGKILFSGFEASGKRGLWVTDGTAAGTHELIQGARKYGLIPTDLTPYNGKVLFAGFDVSGDRSLWVTNGTAIGTYKLTGIQGVGKGGLGPMDFASSSDKTFAAQVPGQGDSPGGGGEAGPGSGDSSSDPSGGSDGSSVRDAVGTTITANFIVSDQTTGQQTAFDGDQYTGPVAGIAEEYIGITPDRLNITAMSPNVFIHSGSGDDAIDVAQVNGNNILDGGTGSNFLTGGTGTGTDTFFIDDRGANKDIWSSLVNFHGGDACTFWGVDSSFVLDWQDNQGAVGFTGLTLHASKAGMPAASMTLAGFTKTDLDSGRVSFSFGVDPGSGSSYLYVHGNH